MNVPVWGKGGVLNRWPEPCYSTGAAQSHAAGVVEALDWQMLQTLRAHHRQSSARPSAGGADACKARQTPSRGPLCLSLQVTLLRCCMSYEQQCNALVAGVGVG